jgi:hypothetical protein
MTELWPLSIVVEMVSSPVMMAALPLLTKGTVKRFNDV